ncbi:TcmI family type II polyketide cyclase [Streptomyces sp. NBC_01476]|uniref:TcmI family type II polyketide cyclase n=1 Tax=Streptomyces sp. NBC_01476 TaxID=2903881 RepID=UPI002E380420|nr:TcmI family type II polyketide cyclase [Streptomyces sp. NBC_01476]
MHRTLIVARMKPGSAQHIADTFAASDQGELPGLIGVTGRSLFQFGDLYMHLIEAERPPGAEVTRMKDHPEFRAISDSLTEYIEAYDPKTWRGPKDAMAREFYRWQQTPVG